jgi:hypothetical protein
MEALSRAGAQVLYEEAVRYAIEKGVEPVVRGTFHPGAGTRVVLEDPDPGRLYGVALDADPETAQVSVVGGEFALDALALDLPLDLPPGVGVPERSGPLTLRWPRVATAQAGDLARLLHARLPG